VNQSKVVVVTGASAGVGRAVARAFAARGDRVALVARGSRGLHAAADEARATSGEKAIAVPADVSHHQEVLAAAERIEAELGPIDVWVNDAMASVFAPFVDIEPDEFLRVTEVTYLGFVYGTLAALRTMVPRQHGVIVQVGSALAYRGIPLQSAYCGAKHAIVGFTESVRTELLHERSAVEITMVQMPAMNTPQFGWVRTRLPNHPQPVPPIYQPEVAARAVVFASEHAKRRNYYVGASTSLTILANKVAPGVLDRYLAATGFQSQQMADTPVEHDRPDNLFTPVDGGHGAHGRFDTRAHRRNPQFWVSTHRAGIGATAAALGVGGAVWRRVRRR
jgi:NAD(P)-dependent dehydrogenase (short-subunit alcohol dehydrogenase family)